MKMRKFILIYVFCTAVGTAFCAEPDDLLPAAGLYSPEVALEPAPSPTKPLFENLTAKLSLEDCIRIALENSPSAVSAKLAVQEANINLNLSKGEFLPTASVQASQSYHVVKPDDFPTSDYGNSSVQAQVGLSLSAISDKIRAVKIQKLALEQAELSLAGQTQEISRAVKKAYYTLLSATRAVNIRMASRDLYQDQYERATEYFRLGLRPKVDVTTAEVNLNNEKLKLIRAQNLVKTASATLANVMGIVTSKVLAIEEIDNFEKITLSFDEAVQTAYMNRPDILSSQAGLKISQIQVNQAKAGLFPTFSFGAQYQKYGDDFYIKNDDTRLTASVEIPIFNAFKSYNKIKQAKVNLEKVQNSSRSLVNNVFLEVQKAYITMQEAEESIPIAELNVEKAKENLELSRGRYNEGIGDSIELKDAEVAYTDAALNLLTARYDYAAAVADLKQAMGTF